MDIQSSQNTGTGNKKQPPPPVFPKPLTNTSAPFSNKENVSSSSKENKCKNLLELFMKYLVLTIIV